MKLILYLLFNIIVIIKHSVISYTTMERGNKKTIILPKYIQEMLKDLRSDLPELLVGINRKDVPLPYRHHEVTEHGVFSKNKQGGEKPDIVVFSAINGPVRRINRYKKHRLGTAIMQSGYFVVMDYSSFIIIFHPKIGRMVVISMIDDEIAFKELNKQTVLWGLEGQSGLVVVVGARIVHEMDDDK